MSAPNELWIRTPTDAASWRVRVLSALSKRVRARSASLGLVETRIFVRSPRRKNLEFSGRKPIWSRTESFDNRGFDCTCIEPHSCLVRRVL